MSDNYKQKALQATKNKIVRIVDQSAFFIRNLWKVIGFGIFVSFWAPTKIPYSHGFKRKSAIEISDLSYYQLVILTAILYTVVCFIAHFIWRWQDKQALIKLLKKKVRLETELGINNK